MCIFIHISICIGMLCPYSIWHRFIVWHRFDSRRSRRRSIRELAGATLDSSSSRDYFVARPQTLYAHAHIGLMYARARYICICYTVLYCIVRPIYRHILDLYYIYYTYTIYYTIYTYYILYMLYYIYIYILYIPYYIYTIYTILYIYIRILCIACLYDYACRYVRSIYV